MLQFLKQIKVVQVENRLEDAWFDMGVRQLREGEVRFYRVNDFVTGNWLFKVCVDKELGKITLKAVKCPPGRRFAQLEGNSMVFQKSEVEDKFYDVISLVQADENDRLHRKIVDRLEEVPAVIRENFEIKSYEEATGKKAPGKNWVTLSEVKDEKAMISLFLLERAWTLSRAPSEEELKEVEAKRVVRAVSLFVRPKIEREVHVKVKRYALANKMEVYEAYRKLVESVLGAEASNLPVTA